jgi:hypothetical protein
MTLQRMAAPLLLATSLAFAGPVLGADAGAKDATAGSANAAESPTAQPGTMSPGMMGDGPGMRDGGMGPGMMGRGMGPGMMGRGPMSADDMQRHRMMHDDMMGRGPMQPGMMGRGMGAGMGQGMMNGGMMGGDMMGMMAQCHAMMGMGMPRLPPGNEKLQLQMQAEMMQRMGEILGKYAARIEEPSPRRP